MSYNYKDLNYIREALACYEEKLCDVNINECDGEEAEELQEDILYMERLRALTERMIDEWENKGPTLTSV
ncbi:hypothetical protein [Microbulbifer sp. ZKSA002]|uniref:hypothetical protein n=1 Tax=Microbulbifer sp. ZKSA002 TaxID=3243388 RepID=UPI00403A2AD0